MPTIEKEYDDAMIKLVALDIDHTLTDSQGVVSQEVLSGIQRVQAEGMHVALISGRPPQGIDEVARLFPKGVYRASYFGAVIHDECRQELRRLSLGIDVAVDLARFADKRRLSLTIIRDDVEYHTQNEVRKSFTPRVSVEHAMQVVDSEKPPVLIAANGADEASALYHYCLEKHGTSVSLMRHLNADESYISTLVVHPEAEKGSALHLICRSMSIEMSEVMAIGDSESDMSMLKHAGIGVAVQNARESVRETAKYITPLPYGDGVRWALENLLN